MNKLTRQLASLLVEKLMTDIPHNINIISKEGEIIASGNKKRIGDFHPSGKKAAESKQTVLVYEDKGGEKPGANEPIIIDDEVIGVVGISGPPDQVAVFSKILSTATKLMINQEEKVSLHYEYLSRKEQLLLDLLNLSEESYSHELIQEAQDYFSVNLKNEFTVGFTEKNEVLTAKYLQSRHHFVSYKTGYLLFFKANQVKEEQIANCGRVFLDTGFSLKENVKNILNTYLYVNYYGIETDQKIYAKDYPNFLLENPHLPISRYKYDHIFSLDDQSVETLKVFVKNNMNQKETSQDLFIHRNSLIYRLDKIRDITGLDPRNINDLLILSKFLLLKYKHSLIHQLV